MSKKLYFFRIVQGGEFFHFPNESTRLLLNPYKLSMLIQSYCIHI